MPNKLTDFLLVFTDAYISYRAPTHLSAFIKLASDYAYCTLVALQLQEVHNGFISR